MDAVPSFFHGLRQTAWNAFRTEIARGQSQTRTMHKSEIRILFEGPSIENTALETQIAEIITLQQGKAIISMGGRWSKVKHTPI